MNPAAAESPTGLPLALEPAKNTRPLSIVLCWAGISGYMAACWRALAQRPGFSLAILSTPSTKFHPSILEGLGCHVMTADEAHTPGFAAAWVADRKPDVVFVSGWNEPSLQALAYDRRLTDVPFALGLDNPWTGSLRQHLAPFALRRYLKRFACIIVPGERAWNFARRLGGDRVKIVKGLYGIDCERLSPCLAARMATPGGWPKRFLFVGRYERAKAPDVLVNGYRLYRAAVAEPWPLTVAGRGPFEHLFTNEPDIDDRRFVEPRDQPQLWTEHGAFILSSRIDPWPLVIAEACATGLPVACTDACGSAVELVRDYFNGLTFPAESPTALAKALTWLHHHHDALPAMGARSQQLAAPYSADMWATRWLETLAGIALPS
jgi:glycosyltransferase involved in cell wall biosynthesis